MILSPLHKDTVQAFEQFKNLFNLNWEELSHVLNISKTSLRDKFSGRTNFVDRDIKQLFFFLKSLKDGYKSRFSEIDNLKKIKIFQCINTANQNTRAIEQAFNNVVFIRNAKIDEKVRRKSKENTHNL